MSVDVLESRGIIPDIRYKYGSEYDQSDGISILGPAKLKFVFTQTNADIDCFFGYGHILEEDKLPHLSTHVSPLIGKFESTVYVPLSAVGFSRGAYFVV